jgi:hypothetical protein
MGRKVQGTTWDGRTYWEDESGNREYEGETWDGRKYREDSKGNRTYEGETWDGRKYREDSKGNRTYEDDIRKGETWDGRTYEESRGGCLLTTACVAHAGLRDDCHELQMMRDLRESFLRHFPEGSELLAEYSLVAPQILQNIRSSPERDRILQDFLQWCRAVVPLVERKLYAEAYSRCMDEMDRLKRTYL